MGWCWKLSNKRYGKSFILFLTVHGLNVLELSNNSTRRDQFRKQHCYNFITNWQTFLEVQWGCFCVREITFYLHQILNLSWDHVLNLFCNQTIKINVLEYYPSSFYYSKRVGEAQINYKTHQMPLEISENTKENMALGDCCSHISQGGIFFFISSPDCCISIAKTPI